MPRRARCSRSSAGDARLIVRPAVRRKLAHTLTVAACIGPFLLLLGIFQYWPVLRMLRDSLYSYELLNPDDRSFVGLGNYADIFSNPDTLQSFVATFGFALGTIVVVVPLSFLLAVYLNGKLPARAVVRAVVFLPVVTSAVVIATMWIFLLDPNGLVNSLLSLAGVPRMSFLTSKAQALPSIVMVTVWQQLGFATVLYLSGLQGIPGELEDASRIDGAGPWQHLWHVTLPLLGRTTLFVVVVMTVFALQCFAPPWIMTGGGPEGTTNFVVYDIYQTAFSLQQPGMASAISVVFMLIVLGISLLQMRLLRTRWNY